MLTLDQEITYTTVMNPYLEPIFVKNPASKGYELASWTKVGKHDVFVPLEIKSNTVQGLVDTFRHKYEPVPMPNAVECIQIQDILDKVTGLFKDNSANGVVHRDGAKWVVCADHEELGGMATASTLDLAAQECLSASATSIAKNKLDRRIGKKTPSPKFKDMGIKEGIYQDAQGKAHTLLEGTVVGNQIHVPCPCCKKSHIHGWDNADSGARPQHKVSHCAENGFKSYYITPSIEKVKGFKLLQETLKEHTLPAPGVEL